MPPHRKQFDPVACRQQREAKAQPHEQRFLVEHVFAPQMIPGLAAPPAVAAAPQVAHPIPPAAGHAAPPQAHAPPDITLTDFCEMYKVPASVYQALAEEGFDGPASLLPVLDPFLATSDLLLGLQGRLRYALDQWKSSR